jgi:tRNA G18 (ribose-2'-O)-methylase SpoU
VVEGKKAIATALDCGWRLRSVLLSENQAAAVPGLVDDAQAAGVEVMVAPQEVLNGIAGYPVHRGALALAERPTPEEPVVLAGAVSGPVLIAEGVSDHENIGSLFRVAAAFGVGAVLLDPTSGDPLYRRAVRVSMGHVMKVPFARYEADEWPSGIGAAARTIVALTPHAQATIKEVADVVTEPWALLVGSEADGLTRAALDTSDLSARIPMVGAVDSLNVATAAAVGLYALSCRS